MSGRLLLAGQPLHPGQHLGPHVPTCSSRPHNPRTHIPPAASRTTLARRQTHLKQAAQPSHTHPTCSRPHDAHSQTNPPAAGHTTLTCRQTHLKQAALVGRCGVPDGHHKGLHRHLVAPAALALALAAHPAQPPARAWQGVLLCGWVAASGVGCHPSPWLACACTCCVAWPAPAAPVSSQAGICSSCYKRYNSIRLLRNLCAKASPAPLPLTVQLLASQPKPKALPHLHCSCTPQPKPLTCATPPRSPAAGGPSQTSAAAHPQRR